MNNKATDERRVVHVERQGNTQYTYYDDGIVKITHFKPKKKVYWGRIFVAIVVFVLLIFGIYELVKAAASGSSDDDNQFIFDSSSVSEQTQSEAESEQTQEESSLAEEIETDSESEASYSNMSFKVCIDAGHGDYDQGEVYGDVIESEQMLELAELVRDYLEECGVTVVMTRESDEYISLSDRCTIANQSSADFYLSLHRTSDEYDSQTSGVSIWVNNNKPDYDTILAQNILNALSGVGISQNMGVNYGHKDNSDSNYQANTDTVMPSCLIDLGYVTNETDNALFEENIDEYAKAIGEAVIETAIELEVVDADGTRLLNEQLISDGKTTVTEN
ncbi:MAG: N-acetylmuramoyl-L-alanine amidase [Ruminococcus sp.]|nr:N-acetylmuramoyl-L-alanine amidase [Ruminococcus sp.]